MADRTVTIPEPDAAAPISVVLTREARGAGFRATLSYSAAGVDHTATVDLAELTSAQRTALQSALAPILALAKTKMGF